MTGDGIDDVESERSEEEGEGGGTTENLVVASESGGDVGTGVCGVSCSRHGTKSPATGASICRRASSSEQLDSTEEAATKVTVGTRRVCSSWPGPVQE